MRSTVDNICPEVDWIRRSKELLIVDVEAVERADQRIRREFIFKNLCNVWGVSEKANKDNMERQQKSNPEMREIGHLQPALFAELTALRSCDDSEFEDGFSTFIVNLKEDFFIKEKLMESKNVRQVKAYKKTHAELLMLLQHAEARAMLKDLNLGRKIVDMLPHWYLRHCFV